MVIVSVLSSANEVAIVIQVIFFDLKVGCKQ